jgi:hypothetical protein
MHIFSERKNPWFRKVLGAALGLAVAALVFTGCPQPTDSDDDGLRIPFTGYYQSEYNDGVEIKENSFFAYDDDSKTISYAGTIVYNNETTKILIIFITNGGTWVKTAGYYYAVAYEVVSSDTIKTSSATSSDYTDPVNKGLPTLVEAIEEYTAEKRYYEYFGEYQRVE